jgi:hypothetical protein
MSSFMPVDDEEWEDEILDDDELNTQKILEIDNSTYTVLVYILGRFNPVHRGHMASIMAAIKLAKKNNGKALILLGDGDKKTKGTIENPLSFDFKKEIIEKRIAAEYKNIYEGYYEIEQKTGNPISHIKEFVERNTKDGKMPYIIHMTAAKAAKEGEKSDADKLEFINKYLLDAGFKQTHSIAIEPLKTEGIEMSATAVRKFAVNHDKGEFIEQYSGVYGEEQAGQVYDEINNAYKNSSMILKAKYAKRTHDGEEVISSSTKKRRGGKRKSERKNKKKRKTQRYKSIAK